MFVGIVQIVNNSLETSNGLEATQFLREIRKPNGVVEDSIRPVIVGIGPSDDTNHGEVLGIRTGDGVEDAEAADGEGDRASADPARAGEAVCGVAGIELVAAADEVEAGLGDEVIEEGEVEVPGDGEDVGGADLDEAPGDVTAEGALRGAYR